MHQRPFPRSLVLAAALGLTASCNSDPKPKLDASGGDLQPVLDRGPSDQGLEAGPDRGGQDAGPLTISLQAIGAPTWKPVGFNLFSGPCGPAGSQCAGGTSLLSAVLPNEKFYTANHLFGPDKPHDPPYDDEIADGLKAKGIASKTEFTVAELTAPEGLFMGFVLVPDAGAPVGASPELGSGPLLEPAAFPLKIDGDLYLNGLMIDPEFDSLHPPLQTLTPPPPGTSYSHLLVLFAENSDFIQVVAGAYEFRVSLTGANGSGWTIRWPFRVK